MGSSLGYCERYFWGWGGGGGGGGGSTREDYTQRSYAWSAGAVTMHRRGGGGGRFIYGFYSSCRFSLTKNVLFIDYALFTRDTFT